MRLRILPALIASALLACAVVSMAETTAKETFSAEPAVVLKDALSLAEQYILTEKIDTSRHFLESIRLAHISDNPKGGRQWIVTWTLKIPADGGQIFILVNMDKSVLMRRGL